VAFRRQGERRERGAKRKRKRWPQMIMLKVEIICKLEFYLMTEVYVCRCLSFFKVIVHQFMIAYQD
jgi:hypothetical protein